MARKKRRSLRGNASVLQQAERPFSAYEIIPKVAFNAEGLVPAIAQQHDTGEVLMMAWMSAASLRETLDTGRVCYWSRSRRQLWRKGETSGHHQKLIKCTVDCDGDTILLSVNQTGAACHTGARTCFFQSVDVIGDAASPASGPAQS